MNKIIEDLSDDITTLIYMTFIEDHSPKLQKKFFLNVQGRMTEIDHL